MDLMMLNCAFSELLKRTQIIGKQFLFELYSIYTLKMTCGLSLVCAFNPFSQDTVLTCVVCWEIFGPKISSDRRS